MKYEFSGKCLGNLHSGELNFGKPGFRKMDVKGIQLGILTYNLRIHIVRKFFFNDKRILPYYQTIQYKLRGQGFVSDTNMAATWRFHPISSSKAIVTGASMSAIRVFWQLQTCLQQTLAPLNPCQKYIGLKLRDRGFTLKSNSR